MHTAADGGVKGGPAREDRNYHGKTVQVDMAKGAVFTRTRRVPGMWGSART